MPSWEPPPDVVRTVTGYHGEAGRAWLAGLSELLEAVLTEWQLTWGDPFPPTVNVVTPVTCADGSAAVLKVGPSRVQLGGEAAALAAFDGRGAVRLLRHDGPRGALLLERAEPGHTLRALVPARDEEATAAVIDVARRPHRAPPAGCRLRPVASVVVHLEEQLRRGRTAPPARLVRRAAAVLRELGQSAPAEVVLHGDLHHDNVLRAGREPWLAVDPHGWVGDPGYNAGALIYNPDPARPDPGLLALVPARIQQLADGLGLDVDRVVAWGFVMGVLSEVWTAEGGGAVGGRALAVAESLLPRLP